MIIIFCGVPGSGKTTVAKQLLPKLEALGSVKVLHGDDLKPPVYRKISALFVRDRGKFDFFIFDATFYKEIYRKNLKHLAGKEKAIVVFFDASEKAAQMHNQRRKKKIPFRGLRAMFAAMERPRHPDITIPTQKLSARDAAHTIFVYARKHTREEREKKRRVFVALSISDALRKTITRWSIRNKKIARLRSNKDMRWLANKNLHITLIPPWYEKSGGIEKIKNKLNMLQGEAKPFTVVFHEVRFGPDAKKPRLVWAEGDTTKELGKLKQKLEKLLKKNPEKRPLFLHVTLARFRPEAFSSFRIKRLDERVAWEERVRALVLMESHLSPRGADYEIIHKVQW